MTLKELFTFLYAVAFIAIVFGVADCVFDWMTCNEEEEE
jgi:hypothetical protein